MNMLKNTEKKILEQLTNKFINDVRKELNMHIYPEIKGNILFLTNKTTKKLSLEELQTIFSQNYPRINGVTHFRSKSRARYLTDARSIFCHIARRMRYTTVEIGKFLNKDHTTVVHMTQKTNDLLQTDPFFNELYTDISNKIDDYDKTA